MGACSIRSLLALAFVASSLAACSSDDSGADGSDPTPRTSADANHRASGGSAGGDRGTAAARRPVRLLLLGRFEQPTYIAAPRGERRLRFVVERKGRIRVLRGRRVLDEPFLDIRGDVSTGGESGMLSMAFAPDYDRSRRFYVYYTDNEGFITIDSFLRSETKPTRAQPGSRRNVIRVPHHRFNHKGGQLQFGPDGMLYAGFGDGGGGGDPDRNAQNLGRLLGKMVRIEPRPEGGYAVPDDNPFRGRRGARPEVYAYGLRNPYRFSFDRRRGHLTIGDVGQDEVEEIDFVPARPGAARTPRGGHNFGWSVFEGRRAYNPGRARGHVAPVIDHTQDEGFCSIIGGYVIRDRSLGRGWYGRYVYGDLCNPTIRLARLRRGTAPTRRTRLRVQILVSFGEDGRGRVYAVSLSGPVYRIGRR
ncbi:MAG: PQQ-dependent sugar dehydrogenase [Thermoleophilaceae bacterium]|nr:PQQ-dependent sugar dehydrogenase [Thermoleophilaceae bacterium]